MSELQGLKSVKIILRKEQIIKLHAVKLTRGISMSKQVEQALDAYFEELERQLTERPPAAVPLPRQLVDRFRSPAGG